MSRALTFGGPEALTSKSGEKHGFEGMPYDWPNRDVSELVEAGGLSWHVQRMGAGNKLLLIHGTAASTHTWRDLMPILARDYDVLAMDLPGHGYTSSRPDAAMTLDSVSDSVCELLESMNFRPDYIAGHSAGAAIALRMSIHGCASPIAIVGLNAALLPFGGALKAVFSPMAQLFATTRLMPRMVARRARDPKAVRRILVGTGSSIDDEGVELYQGLLRREGHVSAVLNMMASWDLKPLLQDLPALEARLYLLAGGRDKAVDPGEADKVASRFPGIVVTRLDDCGHLAHEEAPERVADLIRQACRPQAKERVNG
jgi:magnesium chelatase accessory protein